MHFIASAKDVICFCLCGSGITQKLPDEFAWKRYQRWVVTRFRSHWILEVTWTQDSLTLGDWTLVFVWCFSVKLSLLIGKILMIYISKPKLRMIIISYLFHFKTISFIVTNPGTGMWIGICDIQRSLCSYPLWLQVTFLLQDLTVSDFGLDEVLLGGGQEEAFRIHRSNDIIPDGTALTVITTHPPWQILLNHLQTAVVLNVMPLCHKENSEALFDDFKEDFTHFTSGGCQSVVIVSTFICFLNSKCCKKS